MLAEYAGVDDILRACRRVRDAGYTKWDAHTPFPIHGIEEAMGVRPTILPWIVLCGGLVGLAGALLMQWWMNAVDYPYLVSGKPYFSLPAFVPITFELTVLLSALTSFFSVLALNLLPQPYHPLFRNDRFRRATSDRFFISIDGDDPLFDPAQARALLEGTGPEAIEEVYDEAGRAPLPRPIVYVAASLVALSLLPLAMIAKARFTTSEKPRLHVVWDMDWQKKYKAQKASPLFPDGRAMRPPVPGTVARGDFLAGDDTPFFTGKNKDGSWVQGYPIPVDAAVMRRGRERMEIYCAPCHGVDGRGRGPVAVRMETLMQTTTDSAGWVPPLNLVDPTGTVVQQPNGQIFATITNGIRTMPSYGAQIPPQDRWAIVLYIRALQKAENAQLDELPPEERAAFRGK